MANIERGNSNNIQIDDKLKISSRFELPIKSDFTGDSAGSIALKSNNLLSYKDNLGNIVELSIGDLSLYALKNSPIFTGIPQAPTASPGTNTTQLATTAFVLANSAVNNLQAVTTTGNFTDKSIQITGTSSLDSSKIGLALYTGSSTSSTIAYIKDSVIKSSLVLGENSSTITTPILNLTSSSVSITGDTTTTNLIAISSITAPTGTFTNGTISDAPTIGTHITNKTYVDDLVASIPGSTLQIVTTSGNTTDNTILITGQTNFDQTLDGLALLHDNSYSWIRSTKSSIYRGILDFRDNYTELSHVYNGGSQKSTLKLQTETITDAAVSILSSDFSTLGRLSIATGINATDAINLNQANTLYIDKTTNQTIGGLKTFTNFITAPQYWMSGGTGGANILSAQTITSEDALVWQKATGGSGQARFKMVNDATVRDYRLPASSGTLALLSDISGGISLTTTGTSGVATLVGTVLNIPNYTISNYVTTDSTQTSLSGDKTWTGNHIISGADFSVVPVLGTGGMGTFRYLTSDNALRLLDSSTYYTNTGYGTIFSNNNNFTIKNGGDNFSLGISTTGFTAHRVALFPDKNGTVAYLSDLNTVSNGLTLSSGDIQLGGTLDFSTSIETENNNFMIQSSTRGAGRINITGNTTDSVPGLELENINSTAVGDKTTMSFYHTLIRVSGEASAFSGINYVSDYSANYTNRSLVDKEYVDNVVTAGIVGGRYNGSGDGVTLSITVAHGLTGVSSSSIPVVNALNSASGGFSHVLIDSTNLVVVYAPGAAPANGTNNLSYSLIVIP